MNAIDHEWSDESVYGEIFEKHEDSHSFPNCFLIAISAESTKRRLQHKFDLETACSYFLLGQINGNDPKAWNNVFGTKQPTPAWKP